MNLLKVEGSDSLARDTSSMAIVNTNKTDYERYIATRAAASRRQEQLDRHENDINSIKNDLADIKKMLVLFFEEKHGRN